MTEEWPNVKVEVLAILPHARAFEAVSFGLCDPGLAGLNDRRAQMRGCVSALLDFDDVCASQALASFFVEKVFVHRRLLPSGPGAK